MDRQFAVQVLCSRSGNRTNGFLNDPPIPNQTCHALSLVSKSAPLAINSSAVVVFPL
jgi:hypothetical protein